MHNYCSAQKISGFTPFYSFRTLKFFRTTLAAQPEPALEIIAAGD